MSDHCAEDASAAASAHEIPEGELVWWPDLSDEEIAVELAACESDPAYFIDNYCHLKGDQSWEPFHLWDEQIACLDEICEHQQTAVLKARQLGLTWLLVAYALWLMIFHPGATILLISLREEDAIPLIDERLRPMYKRLPPWLRPAAPEDGSKRWKWPNGSVARALPSNRGDSYTATLAVVDEADLIPKLGKLLESVEPTINDGGKLVLISRSDKHRPGSTFKRLFKDAWEKQHSTPEDKAPASATAPDEVSTTAALDKGQDWRAVFLPWSVRPGRDDAWYQKQVRKSLAAGGNLDAVHSQYPSTPEEALSPGSSNKRLPGLWLDVVTQTSKPIAAPGVPALPGLRIYAAPVPGRRYTMGADPAEGLPTSDDSSVVIGDKETGEEVAVWQGKIEPKHALPAGIEALSAFYNRAPCLVERNNHGHATIGALQTGGKVVLISGHDGRPGYVKTNPTRAKLWTEVGGELSSHWVQAQQAKEQGSDYQAPAMIRDLTTRTQVGSLEQNTCKAPTGEKDDVADGWGLMQWGRIHHHDHRISKARFF